MLEPSEERPRADGALGRGLDEAGADDGCQDGCDDEDDGAGDGESDCLFHMVPPFECRVGEVDPPQRAEFCCAGLAFTVARNERVAIAK